MEERQFDIGLGKPLKNKIEIFNQSREIMLKT